MKAEISVKVAIEVTGDKKKTLFKGRNKELESIIKGFLDGVLEEVKKHAPKKREENEE